MRKKEAASLFRVAALALGLALFGAPAPTTGQSSADGVVQFGPDGQSTPSGYYFRFAGGVSDLAEHGSSLGANLSLAFGKHAFFSTLRGEVEASIGAGSESRDCWYRDRQSPCHYAHYNTQTLSLMATTYFDFREGKAFRPFVGAGLRYEGLSTSSTWTNARNYSQFGLGVHTTAGIAYAIRPEWVGQLGYRALYGNSREYRLQIGVRYNR